MTDLPVGKKMDILHSFQANNISHQRNSGQYRGIQDSPSPHVSTAKIHNQTDVQWSVLVLYLKSETSASNIQ